MVAGDQNNTFSKGLLKYLARPSASCNDGEGCRSDCPPLVPSTAVPHFDFAACTDFWAVRSHSISGDAVLRLFLCGKRVCSMPGIYFAYAWDIRRCASQPPVE